MARRAKRVDQVATAKVDYVAAIQRLDWNELIGLWQQIAARDTPGWPDGKALEHLIIRAFQLSGADVEWPYKVLMDGEEIEQIDGMVRFDHITCLIEAKDATRPVNIEPVAKLRNQLMRRPAGVIGSVFSYGGFTNPAIVLAQFVAPQAVVLWPGEEIEAVLGRQDFCGALRRKYVYLQQMGLPNFDTRTEYLPR
jgi:hypothetical protein